MLGKTMNCNDNGKQSSQVPTPLKRQVAHAPCPVLDLSHFCISKSAAGLAATEDHECGNEMFEKAEGRVPGTHKGIVDAILLHVACAPEHSRVGDLHCIWTAAVGSFACIPAGPMCNLSE